MDKKASLNNHELLSAVLKAAEDVLTSIKKGPAILLFSEEAINWSDLHCADVRFVKSVWGHQTIEVVVEECDPSSTRFLEHVHEKLQERHEGIPIAVIGEW